MPITASGTIGRPAWIASRKLPALKRADAAVATACAFGVDDQRQPFGDEGAPAAQDAAPIGMPAIDEQVPAAPQMPAEHREPASDSFAMIRSWYGSEAKMTGVS